MTHLRSFIHLLLVFLILQAVPCRAASTISKHVSLEEQEENGKDNYSPSSANTPYLRRSNFEVVTVSMVVGEHGDSFGNIEAQDLTSFRKKHNLKSDARLGLYDFSASVKNNLATIKKSHIVINSDQYSLENLKPMDIYTQDATVIIDGEEQENMGSEMNESNIFLSEEDNYTILLGTDTNDNGKREIEYISIFCKNGPEVHMESIKKNILAPIKAEDFHPDYVKILNKLEMKGISSNMKTMIENGKNDEEEARAIDEERLTPNLISSRDDFMVNEKRKTEQVLSSTTYGCSSYYMINVAIAFDSTFCAQSAKFGHAKKQIEAVIAQATIRFQGQGVCTKVLISHLEGYCKPATDPYKSFIDSTGNIGCGTNVGVLDEIEKYWFADKSNVNRKVTHFAFAKNLNENVIGCAKIDNLCSKRMSYGVENYIHYSSPNLRGILFTHELGHNIGLRHINQNIENHTNPRYIMRRAPGAGGGTYAWSYKSINHLKSLLNEWDVGYNCIHKQ